MLCSRCGKSLMAEDQRCPHCGNPVGESRFEGTPYTSAQIHIRPGMRISFAGAGGYAASETAFGGAEAPNYTRTTYTTMPDADKEEGDVDSRTTYRPVYEGASAPEEVRRDMRAQLTDSEEEPASPQEDLSDEAIETLNAVDEELKMENMDLSQFRSRPIQSSGRAGISAGVSDYIQKLEANQTRKAARKRRVYEEDMDEAYATPQEEGVYAEDIPVNPDIDTEQPEVFDDIDEAEFEELRYGRTIGVREILKITLFLVVAAALIVGGVLWFRNVRGNQSSAPIEGVSETLYTDGIAQLKAHVDSTYINEMLTLYSNDGILSLTTALQEDTDALDALLPEEPATNDALFISALQAIQTNIGNAIMMDANAIAQGSSETAVADSEARWTVVNNSIAQLEAATSAAELTAVLNGEQITVVDPTTPTPAPTVAYTTLTRGDKSDAVLDMQNRLYELGFLLDDRDGNFGSKTQTAVKLFQSAAGLSVTGIADQETLSALYAVGCAYSVRGASSA